MKEKPFIATCGDVCSECPRYIATLSNNTNGLATVADLWFRTGLRNRVVSIEDIKCHGCSKAKACAYEINSCIHLEGIETCGECKLFPCQKIEAAFKRSDNFEVICKKNCCSEDFQQLYKAFFQRSRFFMIFIEIKKPRS